LHYDIGFFNGPDLSLNNDNNSTLFSVGIGIRPTGVSPNDDEYQFKEGPFTYGFGGSYSASDDSGTLDTNSRFQPTGVRLSNEWFGLFADVQGYRWRGWLSWADFESDAEGGLATNTKGKLTDSISSTALTLGISRSYQSSAENLGFAWALQYQYVDNEHPSRTMFFRPLTGRSVDELARGMNQGEVYQGMLTWQLAEKVRLINELSYYSPDDGGFSYPAFISQLQIDF
jgi:hypothetical protein